MNVVFLFSHRLMLRCNMAFVSRNVFTKAIASANAGGSPGFRKLTHNLLQTARYQTTLSTTEIQPNVVPQVKPVTDIPGPRVVPIIGSLLPLHIYKEFDKKGIHKLWRKLVDEYGPIMQLSFPGLPNIVGVTSPDDCETLIRSTMASNIRPPLQSLKKVRLKAVDDYFEQKTGILNENDEEWRRVRTRVQTPMMKPKNVTAYLPEMDEVSLAFMDRISMLQQKYGEMPKDFQVELYKWALESVSLVALGRRLGCLQPDLKDDSEQMRLIHAANNIFEGINDVEMSLKTWKFWPTRDFRRLQRSHDAFLKIADETIKETEAKALQKTSEDGSDLTLMEELLLNPGLSRKDIVTLILDMLVAGIDTTSHTLGFCLYLLARNPKCQAKLQEEVDTILGDLKGPLTPKHLGQVSYLKAVVKESLRLFPLTLGVMRELDKNVVLSGYLVPKGHMVFALNIFMSQDESIFPRAKEFIPERWLRHKPLGPIHPYASLPFGAGARMCIGRRIAEQEIFTFLIRVMQRYSVEYNYKDMDMVTRLVFIPSEPLRFSFTERKTTS